MNILKIEILALLKQMDKPLTIKIIYKYCKTCKSNSKQNVRKNICKLRNWNMLRTTDLEKTCRKQLRNKGQYAEQYYQITKKGKDYIDYIQRLIEKKTGQKVESIQVLIEKDQLPFKDTRDLKK